jgi:hypothetical protein
VSGNKKTFFAEGFSQGIDDRDKGSPFFTGIKLISVDMFGFLNNTKMRHLLIRFCNAGKESFVDALLKAV